MDNNISDFISLETLELQNKWRQYHTLMVIVLSLVGFLCEVIMALVIPNTSFLDTSFSIYVIRFLVIPSAFYFLVIILCISLKKFTLVPDGVKNYIVSFGFAFVCLAICYFHDYFVGVFASGILAIFLTVVYCDKILSISTSCFIFLGELLIGFFNTRDETTVKDDIYITNLIICLVVIISSCFIALLTIKWIKNRIIFNSERHFKLVTYQEQATVDTLTGLQNRRSLRNFIETNHNEKIYVMCDIDKFKTINDTWGHQKGDEILSGFGTILKLHTSNKLIIFRYGGDEFLLVFLNSTLENVFTVCNQIQEDFDKLVDFGMKEIGTGISIGIAQYNPNDKPNEAIHRADSALYKAKNSRNEKIIVF